MRDEAYVYFRMIEREIGRYHQSLRRLEQIRAEYATARPSTGDENQGGGRSNLPGDPTHRSVAVMMEDRRYQHLDAITSAIRRVYEALPPERQRFVVLRYWSNRRLTWEGLAAEVPASRRALMYWRNDIVVSIAKMAGLKD